MLQICSQVTRGCEHMDTCTGAEPRIIYMDLLAMGLFHSSFIYFAG